MKNITNTLLIIIVSGMLLVSCKRKEQVVAYVGRKKIAASEFKRRVNELPEYYLGFVATEGGKRQYLSGMIREEVLLQKAKDMGIDRDPEVKQRLDDLKRETLLASVVTRLQRDKVRVSDQEVEDFFEKNQNEFQNPEQIKVSHILVSDEKTAKEVIEKLAQGKAFDKVARDYSIDTVTAINGGDLGYFGRGEIEQPEFEEEVFKLKKVGELSSIIKTPFGYHVAKLTGRRRGQKKTFEEAKDEIKISLEKRKFNSIIEEYRKEYNVKVNYDILDELKIVEDEKVKKDEK
jgi:peptidyl-prolyl cis-trans isomerase C